ncbi:hypothetical protein [Microbacterium sp. ZXX196]|uniref:hypothetical protein n=1 Tax=Microbacterium sp. ZXX196 TaxID=2609291 RepID=UPI0012B97653|nr:hypothetical protein [Microbacterium sp. ZXX196]MTE22652.1 hypothetical protein [Microbacterium sp. ZXX196]
MTTTEQGACLCGCGGTPAYPGSRYLPGHDRRHIEQLVSDVLAGREEAGARAELQTASAQSEFDRRLVERA